MEENPYYERYMIATTKIKRDVASMGRKVCYAR